jgi:hypothetical protein
MSKKKAAKKTSRHRMLKNDRPDGCARASFSVSQANKSTARLSSKYLSNMTGHRARSNGPESDDHSKETPFARQRLGIRLVTAKVTAVARTNCQRTFPAILGIGSWRRRHYPSALLLSAPVQKSP